MSVATQGKLTQGIKILGDAEVGSLTFKSVPFFNNTVEFVFADFELSCNCTVYASRTEIQIEVNIADSTIQIALDREQLGQESKNYKAQYTHNEICKNVTGELNLFNFLVRYAAGAPFKVYESEIIRISPQFPKVEGLQEEAARFLRHFEVLKAIERIKGIRFLDIPFNSITEASILLAQNVLDAVMGTPIIETMTGTLQFDVETVTDEVRDLLNKCKGEDGQQVDLINNSREFVTLYSHTIDIGYKRVEILNAFALEPIVESSKGTIKISSTSGQQRLTYSTDPWTS